MGRAAHEHKIFFLASALAFDALLAAIPFALLVLGGVGYMLHSLGSQTDIHWLLDEFLPAHGSGMTDPFSAFEEIAQGVADSRGDLSIWGALLFVWFATRFFASVRHALNDVLDAEEHRGAVVTLGAELSLVLVTALMFAANALISVPTFVSGFAARFLGLCSAFGFGVFLFAAVYTVAPARRLPWHTIMVASLVASLAFEVAKQLFALYLSRFVTIDELVSNANVIGMLLFLIWLYYMACAFLIGAEVGGAYDEVVRERSQKVRDSLEVSVGG